MNDVSVQYIRRGMIGALVLAVAAALGAGSARAQEDEPKEDVGVWIDRLASEQTRDQARDHLRDLGAEAVGALVKSLHHADAVIRSESAFVLGRIARKEAVGPLIESLVEEQAIVRMKSAYALGEIADARAIDPLVKALSDVDGGVRANACFALGQIGSPRPARELVRALDDPDENVRNYAASALGSTKDRRALAALEWVALNDPSSDVRALAAASLGSLGDLRVCPVLVTLLDDREDIVRGRAIESLLLLTRERRGYEHRDPEPRRAASVARWKNWLKGQRLAVLPPQTPGVVCDWWSGKFEPRPEVKPVPPPGAPVEPPAETEPDLLGPGALPKTAGAAESEALCRQALKASPDSAPAQFHLAELLFRTNRLAEARKLFEALAKVRPMPEGVDASVVKLRLGTCLRRYGETAKASAALEEAVDGATDAWLLCESARQFVAMKQFARAKALLERAYNLSAGDPESARLTALFLLRVPDETLRDPGKAAVYAEVAYTAKPADERCVSAMAEAKWACGERGKAVELIEGALKTADSGLLRKQLEDYRHFLIETEKRAEPPKEERKPDAVVAPGA